MRDFCRTNFKVLRHRCPGAVNAGLDDTWLFELHRSPSHRGILAQCSISAVILPLNIPNALATNGANVAAIAPFIVAYITLWSKVE